MRPDLLALDLDGTLLPRSKELPDRTRRAVARLAASGVRVVLATGKTFHLTARYAADMGNGERGIEGPLICLDGTLVRYAPAGETLRAVGVSADRVRDAAARLDGLDLRSFLVDAGDRLLVHAGLSDWHGTDWIDFLGVYASEVAASPRPERDARGDPHFYALLGPRDAVLRGEDLLRPFGGDGLEVFRASFFSRDVDLLVLRPRTDKGDALALVAERYGVDRERVAAVGDWRNDLGMIRWAGLGVAMANSHPDLIEAADLVLPGDSDSDALAEFLEGLA
jgi:hydroxymethylpyrimidine pyrophosphatase-like HAD family hydrolase